MNYFDDLLFLSGEELPQCRHRIDAQFQGIYTLQLIRSGRIYFQVDGGPLHRIETPALFWHHPGRRYAYGPDQDDSWHHFWISFRGPRARRILEQGFMPLSAAGWMPVGQLADYIGLFSRMLTNLRSADVSARRENSLLLERILWLAQQECRQTQPVHHRQDCIERIMRDIREKPEVAYDIRDLAKRAGCAVSHFRRLFVQISGLAVYEYALTCRMQKAARLLSETSLTVEAVSSAAGYPDSSQFSRMFKRRLGLSPRAYRTLAGVSATPVRK